MMARKTVTRKRKPTTASGDVDRGAALVEIDDALDNDAELAESADGTAVAESTDLAAQLLKKYAPKAKKTAKQRDADAVVQGTLTKDELSTNAGDDIKALRWWGQISYVYESDAKGAYPGISEADWRANIKQRLTQFASDYCDELAFIYHDQDIEYNKKTHKWEPKGLHIHFEFAAKNRQKRTRKAVLRALEKAGLHISRDENFEHVSNWAATTQYLIHISEGAMADRKHIYPVSDVAVWQRGKGWVDSKAADDWMQHNLFGAASSDMRHASGVADAITFYTRMVACGALTPADVRNELLVDRRGLGLKPTQRSMVLAAAKDAEDAYHDALAEYYLSHFRQLVTVYVHGPGNSGKSALAQKLAVLAARHLVPRGCNDGGVHKGTSNGKTTPDPFQGYTNQAVAVFDEFSVARFDPDVFLEVFSPTTVPVVPRRNSNCLWYSNWAFICNSISVEAAMADGFDVLAKQLRAAQSDASRADRKSWTGRDYRDVALAHPEIGDKLYQLHRRIAIDIELHDDHSVDVYARSDAASRVRKVYADVHTCASLSAVLPALSAMIDSSASVCRYRRRGDGVHELYMCDGNAYYLLRLRLRDVFGGVMIDYIDVYGDWGLDARRIATSHDVYCTLHEHGTGADMVIDLLRQAMHYPNGAPSFSSVFAADAPGPRYDHVGHLDDAYDHVDELFQLLLNAEAYYYEINGYPRYDQRRPVFCPVHLAPNMWGECSLCSSAAKTAAVNAEAAAAKAAVTNIDAADADASNVDTEAMQKRFEAIRKDRQWQDWKCDTAFDLRMEYVKNPVPVLTKEDAVAHGFLRYVDESGVEWANVGPDEWTTALYECDDSDEWRRYKEDAQKLRMEYVKNPVPVLTEEDAVAHGLLHYVDESGAEWDRVGLDDWVTYVRSSPFK